VGVAVSTDVVRIDAGVGLVGEVRVVRTSGVGAVGAAAGSSSVAVRAGSGRVNTGVELVGELGVVGTGGVRAVVAGSVVAGGVASQATGVGVVAASEAGVVVSSAGGVASRAVAVRVDTRVSLVGSARVVRTGRVRAIGVAGQAGRVTSTSEAGRAVGGTVGGAGVVASSAISVRVNTRVGLVSQVRVVRTSGV
jgi:hypothetical protein